MRPRIVGEALHQIAADPEVVNALFDILENQKLTEGNAAITLMPSGSAPLAKLFAATPPADGAPTRPLIVETR
jgi:hypothetical protein